MGPNIKKLRHVCGQSAIHLQSTRPPNHQPTSVEPGDHSTNTYAKCYSMPGTSKRQWEGLIFHLQTTSNRYSGHTKEDGGYELPEEADLIQGRLQQACRV